MSSQSSKPSPRVQARLAGIILLFVITIIGMLVHTFLTFHSQKSDALVIDLAGRQRMLHQQHMKQLLLVSQGGEADYHYTRQILNESLAALLHGGPAVLTIGEHETVELPPAPSIGIRQKLSQQKTLIEEFATRWIRSFFMNI